MTTQTIHTTCTNDRHVPGEAGIWVFIFGDMMVFSLFFITFLFYRAQNVPLFVESQTHLSQTFGALNTFFMLSSSWFVALAVHGARKNMGKVTPIGFVLAFFCGLGFAAVKFFEYGEKIRAGITLNTNDFFMYYYMFTGIHFVHVMIGMGVLVFMARYSWAGGYDEKKIWNLESGASFWHLVDLLWIVLFALLYLIK
ncbi:cytochrome c oxidase subunit 3 family protein [Ferribacterium limneticum]|uniref:cytochrome c oxidase subunit 3 family protein n=1 Tax=Ferribacterium limneticum TaxID=76259 RepID=UPI001CF7F18D|nr:cytochrome c oxidase subunit 3 family protein [Ferribacterium limneticum]UCV23673.1 cytochrome c oxidase subunit 3 family protein [Ferribacterium limneticum]